MFIETVTAPREVWEQWSTRLRLFSEPPPRSSLPLPGMLATA